MSSSEWISVSLSAIGFLYAFLVSWIFYRAQQKTDFRSLVEKLLELKSDATNYQKINEYGVHRSIAGVDKLNSIISQYSDKLVEMNCAISQFQREVEAVSKKLDAANLDLLRDSLDKLKTTIDGELHLVISDIKQQVLPQLIKLEGEIKLDIEKSSGRVVDAFSQDLSKFVTNSESQNDLTKHLTNIMQKVTLSAISKQDDRFEIMKNTFAEDLNLRGSKAISSVFDGLDNIKKEVLAIENELVKPSQRERASQK